MGSKKFSFLKSSKNEESNYPKMEKTVIEFVVNEFPDNAKDIREALMHLRNALEGSIDSIEDKSSQIIKHNRDFELSERYRKNSIKLYEISQSVDSYVKWMNKDSGQTAMIEQPKAEPIKELAPPVQNKISISEEKKIKNENRREEKKVDNNLKNKQNKQEVSNEVNKKNNNKNFKNACSILDDFTGKQPIGFKLLEYEIATEDWDDTIVKTAEILTKHFKSAKVIENMKSKSEVNKNAVKKKSPQNECRDTIIEMLNDYGVNPNQYKIYV